VPAGGGGRRRSRQADQRGQQKMDEADAPMTSASGRQEVHALRSIVEASRRAPFGPSATATRVVA